MQDRRQQSNQCPGSPPRTKAGLRKGRLTRSLGLLAVAMLTLPATGVLARAQETAVYSGSAEPCLSPHGDRDRYREGLESVGWTIVPDGDRAAALGVLADTFLPVTVEFGGGWADHTGPRAAAIAFWEDLARNRMLMTRDGQILLLAGFATDLGEMIVECWVAGPETRATDDFLILAGIAYQGDGVVMTQLNIAPSADRPSTEIFVSRLSPPAEIDPPLAGTDGLRTRITFMRPETTL
jgi:hypothetical protein